MNGSKVFDFYRPNIGGWIFFYFFVKLYFLVYILAIHYLQNTGFISSAESSRALMNMAFDSYMALGFVGIVIVELLISMFQWFKKKRKKEINIYGGGE